MPSIQELDRDLPATKAVLRIESRILLLQRVERALRQKDKALRTRKSTLLKSRPTLRLAKLRRKVVLGNLGQAIRLNMTRLRKTQSEMRRLRAMLKRKR